MLARRAAGAPFAATRYEIDPSPWPLVADVITIHCAAFEAAHVQSRVAVTVSDPAPPEAGTVSIELVTVTLHRCVVGAVTDVLDEVHDASPAADSRRRI